MHAFILQVNTSIFAYVLGDRSFLPENFIFNHTSHLGHAKAKAKAKTDRNDRSMDELPQIFLDLPDVDAVVVKHSKE